ncbi:His-Xaa-Ser system radical SAM maturase HxsC [Paraburkholderia caballeronis]|uniref:His-Xaa-Ser system radical SAM maturase HxsC n=1 Tax=Paraburkholderia caballeronis TaxID=416943 RepID=A0A1H7MTF4_9BURK|nr:His-Xaa-Ser system radical SAM maturase HxsC [Paraburkholderia caballeronis]PXW26425.1 His-Xaa-Ser system radical SAM maturase HxsC [Paraburkholderia caballeronis]PXX01972.1 His-Xaa-Ser system radical SAM maturase HxsC [Paraburkholderia caballeronis]RAK01129.1 His-Xaa-Ser system radical SAM maturase HxsC [Paraburkholderia caballeronis]SEB96358.1 His-Xaa-Ser system radical SAM maturase HxsC [Paraburkholderia caballeronis]SEL14552.1 His-Xaa-Ser system radical SAM maturase HxsC [Paraburkholder
MLKLGGKVISITPIQGLAKSERQAPRTVRSNVLLPVVTGSRFVTDAVRRKSAYLLRDGSAPTGYAHYLVLKRDSGSVSPAEFDSALTVLPDEFHYLDDGDIVRLNTEGGNIRVLYRRSSPHNTILVTEQCQHYCLMCSQPPKNVDDSWLDDEAKELIRLMPRSTEVLGFTGGEPTLFGDRFLETLRLTKTLLPHTKIHILSNGRSFADRVFARRYAAIAHPDVTIGIPLYSDDASIHDHIVQAKGAFDETVRGVLNLKEFQQKVEIRVVLHALSVPRLEQLAMYIVRNLLFVDHVALMGLEITGFTRANLDELWVDPFDYKDSLSHAVRMLEDYGLHVSVYNHQLCLVNDDIKSAYRRSISDWKNEYVETCRPCARRHECGGFFSSAVQHKYSAYIRPF